MLIANINQPKLKQDADSPFSARKYLLNET